MQLIGTVAALFIGLAAAGQNVQNSNPVAIVTRQVTQTYCGPNSSCSTAAATSYVDVTTTFCPESAAKNVSPTALVHPVSSSPSVPSVPTVPSMPPHSVSTQSRVSSGFASSYVPHYPAGNNTQIRASGTGAVGTGATTVGNTRPTYYANSASSFQASVAAAGFALAAAFIL